MADFSINVADRISREQIFRDQLQPFDAVDFYVDGDICPGHVSGVGNGTLEILHYKLDILSSDIIFGLENFAKNTYRITQRQVDGRQMEAGEISREAAALRSTLPPTINVATKTALQQKQTAIPQPAPAKVVKSAGKSTVSLSLPKSKVNAFNKLLRGGDKNQLYQRGENGWRNNGLECYVLSALQMLSADPTIVRHFGIRPDGTSEYKITQGGQFTEAFADLINAAETGGYRTFNSPDFFLTLLRLIKEDFVERKQHDSFDCLRAILSYLYYESFKEYPIIIPISPLFLTNNEQARKEFVQTSNKLKFSCSLHKSLASQIQLIYNCAECASVFQNFTEIECLFELEIPSSVVVRILYYGAGKLPRHMQPVYLNLTCLTSTTTAGIKKMIIDIVYSGDKHDDIRPSASDIHMSLCQQRHVDDLACFSVSDERILEEILDTEKLGKNTMFVAHLVYREATQAPVALNMAQDDNEVTVHQAKESPVLGVDFTRVIFRRQVNENSWQTFGDTQLLSLTSVACKALSAGTVLKNSNVHSEVRRRFNIIYFALRKVQIEDGIIVEETIKSFAQTFDDDNNDFLIASPAGSSNSSYTTIVFVDFNIDDFKNLADNPFLTAHGRMTLDGPDISLADCLHQVTMTEQIGGYRCKPCQDKGVTEYDISAKRGFWSLGESLYFAFKRYKARPVEGVVNEKGFLEGRMEATKDQTIIDCPLEIDLAPFLSLESTYDKTDCLYEKFGETIHRGENLSHGHYYARILNSHTGVWNQKNDDVTTILSRPPTPSGDVYMVVYKRKKKEEAMEVEEAEEGESTTIKSNEQNAPHDMDVREKDESKTLTAPHQPATLPTNLTNTQQIDGAMRMEDETGAEKQLPISTTQTPTNTSLIFRKRTSSEGLQIWKTKAGSAVAIAQEKATAEALAKIGTPGDDFFFDE